MLLFFLIISVGNLALGYFVALKYHNVLFPGPVSERELVRPQASSTAPVAPITIDASQLPLVTKEVTPASEPEPFLQPPAPAQVEESKSPVAEEQVPEPPEDQLEAEPEEGAEPTIEQETQEQQVEDSAPNETAASLDDFMAGLMEFRSQLASLDSRVRRCVKTPNSREVEDCIKDFRVANSLYLEQTTEAAERLQQPKLEETDEQFEARSAVQQALTAQAEEVRKAEDELSQMDLSADMEANCETLLRSANTLNASNDKLREDIHSAQREFSTKPHSEPESQAEELLIDELTEISSRYKLELEMRKQVESGISYCVGLVDVDRCGELNLQYGQKTIDSVIKALAQIVAASTRNEVCAARYSGQQFAVIFAGQDQEQAALSAETIRQIVEKTTFQYEGESVEVTVSMVLITGNSSDRLTTIEQRLRTAIAAGKSFGRNRTFQFQDGDVEPVLPPDLEIKSNFCEIKA